MGLITPASHSRLIPIDGRLYDLWRSATVAAHRALEGRHEACRGCAINCYFEPSFAASPENRYFWQSLPSKMHYTWTKFVVQRLRSKLTGPRRALLPDLERPVIEPGGDGAGPIIELPVLSIEGKGERVRG